MQTPGDGQSLRIESEDLYRLFKETRDFDKKLYAQLRKAMRDAGRPIVDDVRSEIMRIPSSGKYRTGVRRSLAAGTSVSIGASSAKSAGIRIKTSPRRLPPGKRKLARKMNYESWRHPVFARDTGVRRVSNRLRKAVGGQGVQSWTWVEQKGRPYFGVTIAKHYPEVQEGLRAAFLRTFDQLHRGID